MKNSNNYSELFTKNSLKKHLKYSAIVLASASVVMLGLYCGTTTIQTLRGKQPMSATEFISNASSQVKHRTAKSAKFADKKTDAQPTEPKAKPKARPVKKVVERPAYHKINGAERERMKMVASDINQNRQHGVKLAQYEPKTNTIKIQFNRKKPTATQKRYARFLLKGLNAQ